jgi:hypothetical protein
MPPAPNAAAHDDSGDLTARDPGLTAILRGMAKIWPVLGAVIGAALGLYVQSVRLEARIDATAAALVVTRTEVAEKAAASDVARLEASLQQLAARQDVRDERTAAILVDIQRTLERVCTRVRCER